MTVWTLGWLIPTVWVAVGILSIRLTLWGKNRKGQWEKDVAMAWSIGIFWPFLTAVGIPAGLGWLVWKGLSIPLYYWATPKEVRAHLANSIKGGA